VTGLVEDEQRLLVENGKGSYNNLRTRSIEVK